MSSYGRRFSIGGRAEEKKRKEMWDSVGEALDFLTPAELEQALEVGRAITGSKRNLSKIDLQKVLSALLFTSVLRASAPAFTDNFNFGPQEALQSTQKSRETLVDTKRQAEELRQLALKFWLAVNHERKCAFEEFFKEMVRLMEEAEKARQEKPVKKIDWADMTAVQKVEMLNLIFGNGRKIFHREIELDGDRGTVVRDMRLGLELRNNEIVLRANLITNEEHRINPVTNELEIFAGEHARTFNREIKATFDKGALKFVPYQLEEDDNDFLQMIASKITRTTAPVEQLGESVDRINTEQDLQSSETRQESAVFTTEERERFVEIKTKVLEEVTVRKAVAMEIEEQAPGLTVDAGVGTVDDFFSLFETIESELNMTAEQESFSAASLATRPPTIRHSLAFGAALQRQEAHSSKDSDQPNP